MTRRAVRRARELREAWLEELTNVRRSDQTPLRAAPTNRGSDYEDAHQSWVCNRKKAYPSQEFAAKVANALTRRNAEDPRPDFAGVVVAPYMCGRCGRWHLGR